MKLNETQTKIFNEFLEGLWGFSTRTCRFDSILLLWLSTMASLSIIKEYFLNVGGVVMAALVSFYVINIPKEWRQYILYIYEVYMRSYRTCRYMQVL